MEKYLIEFIKGAVGSPNFERVTLLNVDGSKNSLYSGDCHNLGEMPIVKEYFTAGTTSFNFTYYGVFRCQYQWQDFRKQWNDCDFDKWDWCGRKGKPTRVIFHFVK